MPPVRDSEQGSVVTVRLDAGPRSALDWSQALEEAECLVAKGHKILWFLDTGLFGGLAFPISHQAQFLTLGLAVDHFHDKVWERFSDATVGCSLYRGPGHLAGLFSDDAGLYDNWSSWLSERGNDASIAPDPSDRRYALFCRDVSVQYLHLLGDRFSGEVPLCAFVDVGDVASPTLQAQLLDRAVWEPIVPIGEGTAAWQGVPWREEEGEMPSVGVCLSQGEGMEALDPSLNAMEEDGIPYRVIPEEFLIAEWVGLDHLLIAPSALGDQGVRKLQGFCAAGGTVVTVDGCFDVSYHQDFASWRALGYKEIN